MNKKAMVAMSGGVDSSVAAYLTKEQGYETIGVTLKLFDNDDVAIKTEKACCSLDDVSDARNVSYKLGIPYYVYNFKDSFDEQVIKRFIDAYETGGTPNPCIDCNRYIKFNKLIQRANELDFDYVVTGHYSIVEYDANAKRYMLKKSVDLTKDQSYVLYSLTQEQLAKTLLPLGPMTKVQVRELAESLHMINAGKHDSQDICFVPDGDYGSFIETYLNKQYKSGNFVTADGKVLGRHKGIIRYTIGQRKGLGLALPRPMYVCKKDIQQNTVILGYEDELFSKQLTAKDINLIAYDKLDRPIRVKAKVRYKQPEQWATVTQTDSSHFHLEFDQPQRAIAKGQAVVLYDDDYVIGGGTIE